MGRRILACLIFFGHTGYAQAKTLVYCAEASPKIFNPQLAVDGVTFNATSKMLYDHLLEFEVGTTKVIPGLAEKWKISADAKEYTLFLRPNVEFHTTENFKPSRPLTSEDVVFTFKRMLDLKHPYHTVNGGSYEYYHSMDFGHVIKDVVAVDPHTVKFVLFRPEAPFLADLAMDFASILSAEYAQQLLQKKTPEKLDLEPVGTGPFQLKRYIKDTQIRYQAFAKYFRGRPKLDEVVFSITPDPSVRFQKLKTNECQLEGSPNISDLAQMQQRKDLTVMSLPGLNIGYLSMNVSKKPFDNLLVRQAVNHALNRQSYIKAIYHGHAEVANTVLPPTQWSHREDLKGYDYNPEKAKQLLKQAGLPEGFETELWTLPVSRPYNPNGKKMGEMIQADLARVGIKVKLVTYKWATYLEKALRGEHSLMMMGWNGDNGDPDNFMNVLLSCASVKGGSNYSRWCDPKFDQLVTQARSVADVKKRTQLYREAQKIFVEQAPWVPLAYAKLYKVLRKGVTGYKVSPFSLDALYEVDLNP